MIWPKKAGLALPLCDGLKAQGESVLRALPSCLPRLALLTNFLTRLNNQARPPKTSRSFWPPRQSQPASVLRDAKKRRKARHNRDKP